MKIYQIKKPALKNPVRTVTTCQAKISCIYFMAGDILFCFITIPINLVILRFSSGKNQRINKHTWMYIAHFNIFEIYKHFSRLASPAVVLETAPLM